MKLASKQLKLLIAEYEDIKAKKSDLEKEEKKIKAQLMGHLEATQSNSVAVGNTTVKKKVSSYGFKVTSDGVKVTAATNDLIQKLYKDGKDNLLSLTCKTTLLYKLQEEKDQYTLDLLKGFGLEAEEKFTLEIK